MFSRFFIERPVFAAVLSIIIVLVGAVILPSLPIDRYPSITPPTVRVTARYLGASAEVVEQTVATPIEQELNGIEHMLYFESKSTNDGQMVLTATFDVGTDLDIAAVQVQNRVAIAQAKLPEEVVRQGITVKKQSTSLLMVIALVSPDETYDQLFLSNFAKINVKDALGRVNGIGDVLIAGEREYGMRLWLRPDEIYKLGLTAADVTRAVREQNLQAAAGRIGQAPSPAGQEFEYTVRAKGRLTEPGEFGDIIVTARQDGSLVRVKDVGRVELGAFDYTQFARLNGKQTANLLLFQMPGSNALDGAREVRRTLEDLNRGFPQGVGYKIVYDATNFITASIEEVLSTLFEAVLLVIFVVFIFLQNWRATLIPLLTVPVSLVGTFMFFPLLGFTVNVLTLFGLVLAIGLVVDDAIVVVEAVQLKMETKGLGPKAAALEAMQEVSGAVVAIALILIAVFVPVAFLSGITGQMYRQFALTIAVSVALSAFNALTLSPALCALLLRPEAHEEKKTGLLSRAFGKFNRGFEWLLDGYAGWVRVLLRRSVLVLASLAVVLFATAGLYQRVPGGFLPSEDEGYFIIDVSLPAGASLERTDAVLAQVEKMMMATEGVKDVFTIGGQSFATGNFNSSVGTAIVVMKPWEEREAPELHIENIVQAATPKLLSIPGGLALAFNVPPISGLGNTGGFNLKVQDRSGRAPEDLAAATDKVVEASRTRPEIGGAVNTFQSGEPQLRMEVDRERVKAAGVPLSDVYETLQTYLGGSYVNDFNLFGRTFRVVVAAESEFRQRPEDIERFYVRSANGDMVPLNTLLKTEPVSGPQSLGHFNLYRAADVLGGGAPGVSSGQAIRAMEEISQSTLPQGFGFEWTGMAYQEKKAGNIAIIFAFSLLVVFLFLAAQYESWLIPIAVVLGVPLGVFGAILAEWLTGIADDVYCRIGLIMLIGLSAKNAILIVEYAKARRDAGMATTEAALEAARLRFRPILMTSFAFILGVVPLVIAAGAGAASRRSLGTAVFGGMLVATILGVFLIPAFYSMVQGTIERFRPGAMPATAPEVPAEVES